MSERISRRAFAGIVGVSAIALGARRAAAQADAAAPATDGNVDDALAEVARARAGLKSLSGPFTQERTIGLLASKVRSRGAVTLVRPDRLRWELAPPDDVVYWVGPEGLAYKSSRAQGRMPASQGKLAAALEDIRVLLGGDLAKLKTRYDLRLVSRGPEGMAFDATPRPGTDAKLDRLQFALGPDRARPTRATLIEGPRDKTDIVFGALERDTNIDPARVRPPF